MTKKQCHLVEEHHNLIYQVIINMGLQIEDYYDIAAIGLCKAAISYNSEHGIKFSTYAYKVIHTAILRDMLDYKRQKRSGESSLVHYDCIYDEENGLTLLDVLDNKECPVEEIAVGNLLMESIESRLNDTGKHVLSLMIKGYTQKAIAQKVGCSQQNISLIKKNVKQMVLE